MASATSRDEGNSAGEARGGCRVLVTGGSGFIGRHLCEALSRAGADVEAWARPESLELKGAHSRLAGIQVNGVDVRDRKAVMAALSARPPDRVFHLAGIRLMGNTAECLAEMFETNVLGALNVIAGLRADTRVVVVGSSEEYGRGPIPFRETQPAMAQTAYSISRLATTLACLTLSSPPICVARLAVVYGPYQTGKMFIPSLLEACAKRQPFAMTSGDQTRDFLYVDDAVSALLALADSEAAMRQVVNVGTSIELTVRQVAEQAVRLSGKGVELQIGAIASRPGEASRYVCATDKLRSLTGWLPKVTLEEGLGRTLEWWRRHGVES